MGLRVSFVDKMFTDRKAATRSLLSCQGYSKCLFSSLNISIRTRRHIKANHARNWYLHVSAFILLF